MSVSKILSFLSLAASILLLNILLFTLPNKSFYYTHATTKTIYIDNEFSQEEINEISQAAWEWSYATRNIVDYKIVVLSSGNDHIDTKNGILINKVSEFNIEVLSADKDHGNYTLGYYTSYGIMPHIGIVYSRVQLKYYKAVILHEFGHALGLGHNEKDEDMETLMYPTIDLGSPEITQKDLVNFCKIHKC